MKKKHNLQSGSELLRLEMQRRGITAAELAIELKFQKSSLSVWLSDKWSPNANSRNIIEDWSGGRVPSRSWDLAKAAVPESRPRPRRASGAL